ncbi:MAG: hypothetical protein IKT98_10550 [Selenomonadaceae bacterium]|nr:hypothetical protein [Selenomonadaceae bacterium]
MFKDDLQTDIDIFINQEEFGEELTIDGLNLRGVLSSSTAVKSTRKTENFLGTFGDFTTVYFKAADYLATRKRLPNFGEYVLVNGKRYVVEYSQNLCGIAKLILSGYRQGTLR